MSVCHIVRRLEDPGATVVRAKEHAVKWGSVFTGDADRGDYRIRTPMGGIEGTYSVAGGSVVTFVIEKKSPIIPLALIEKILDEFLGPTGSRVR